jgi:hypothetical protein
MQETQKLVHQISSEFEEIQSTPVTFEEFLQILTVKPSVVIRNVFQAFHDMVKAYIGHGIDDYSNNPEATSFVCYNCDRLFVEGTDHPFFADRLFANKIIRLVEAWKRGAEQNKIYIFKGPHGCGKSTFLNNLLTKFEEYANTEDGARFETVWRLDRKKLGGCTDAEAFPFMEKINQLLENDLNYHKDISVAQNTWHSSAGYIEVPCPSHDNPILMIPKTYRRSFFDDLLADEKFKETLFHDKEYSWVFRDNPCTICSSLYDALLNKLKSPLKVFETLYARTYRINRRLGEGISVFHPGDKSMDQTVLSNAILQQSLNGFLEDCNQVKYIFSRYAKTNNGIYALMDIKSNNSQRLIELHNIISEGVHKVEDIEENVNSLLLSVMNPEDKTNF